MKYCWKCGEKLEDDVKYCSNCGTSVNYVPKKVDPIDVTPKVDEPDIFEEKPFPEVNQTVQSQPVDETKKTNGYAIAGFVLSFLIPVLGLIFSIIGLCSVKKYNGSGKGLAIAGIVISVVSWALNSIFLSSFFTTFFY